MAQLPKVLDDVIYVFLAYRQSQYLPKTLTSAMQQTVFPSRLIIMDDASPDESDEVIKQLMKEAPDGLNIDYQRNEKNIGLIAQLNKLVGKFQKKLIIIQAGDDEAYPNRVEVTYEAWVNNGKPSLVLANYDGIDLTGNVVEPFEGKKPQKPYSLKRLINRRAMVFGCCAAVDSELFNTFGPIPSTVINEDRVNAFRAMLINGIHYIHQPLLRYRIEGGVSAFKTETVQQRLSKLKVEAEREARDLMCHVEDLKTSVGNASVRGRLQSRRAYLDWVSSLHGPPSISDFLKGLRLGVSPNLLMKIRKKLR